MKMLSSLEWQFIYACSAQKRVQVWEGFMALMGLESWYDTATSNLLLYVKNKIGNSKVIKRELQNKQNIFGVCLYLI